MRGQPWGGGTVHLNLNYTADDATNRQALDLYETTAAAAGTTRVPVAIFVHGGGWGGNNRTLMPALDSLRGPLLARGFSVASIGYRVTKAPNYATHPSQIDDVEEGIRYLMAH